MGALGLSQSCATGSGARVRATPVGAGRGTWWWDGVQGRQNLQEPRRCLLPPQTGTREEPGPAGVFFPSNGPFRSGPGTQCVCPAEGCDSSCGACSWQKSSRAGEDVSAVTYHSPALARCPRPPAARGLARAPQGTFHPQLQAPSWGPTGLPRTPQHAGSADIFFYPATLIVTSLSNRNGSSFPS